MARPQVTGRAPATRDPTVGGFCQRKGISRSTFNRWKRKGLAPDVVQPAGPGGKQTITPEAEDAWDLRYTATTQAAE